MHTQESTEEIKWNHKRYSNKTIEGKIEAKETTNSTNKQFNKKVDFNFTISTITLNVNCLKYMS